MDEKCECLERGMPKGMICGKRSCPQIAGVEVSMAALARECRKMARADGPLTGRSVQFIIDDLRDCKSAKEAVAAWNAKYGPPAR